MTSHESSPVGAQSDTPISDVVQSQVVEDSASNPSVKTPKNTQSSVLPDSQAIAEAIKAQENLCQQGLRFVVGQSIESQPNSFKHVFEHEVKKVAIENAMIISERDQKAVSVYDRKEGYEVIYEHNPIVEESQPPKIDQSKIKQTIKTRKPRKI